MTTEKEIENYTEERNRTIYCPSCLKYGMESQDEDSPVCPVCGANAQWEDEVTLPVMTEET